MTIEEAEAKIKQLETDLAFSRQAIQDWKLRTARSDSRLEELRDRLDSITEKLVDGCRR